MELGPNAGRGVSFTILDSVTVTKGQIMKLLDPFACSGSSALSDVFAGIAAADKVANDTSTKIALHTQGIFDLKCGSQGATLGKLLQISGANLVGDADATDVENGMIVGRALETGSADEVIAVAVGYYP